MRRTTTVLLTAACLALAGCSSSDDAAKDCSLALNEQTGSDASDTPTISEAKDRVDAFDDVLADLVQLGHESVAEKKFDAMERKISEGGKSRPQECESLSQDDYNVLNVAKVIDGLGWTDEDGKFDKLKMIESRNN